MPGFLLPIYDIIDDSSLLGRGFAEINAGGFDTFVSHKVGEECDVIAALQETLCEAVTEGVWINHITVKTVLFGKVLQLDSYATSGKAVA